VFIPQAAWRTIGLNGARIADSMSRDEFTFVCPNRADAREAVFRHLEDALSAGFFQGVFLDRIRFPSPAADPARAPACLCDDCARAAKSAGVDWKRVRARISELFQTPEGKRTIISRFLAAGVNPTASEDCEELN